MNAQIQVEQLADGAFQVRVVEGKTESSHRVTLKSEDYQRLANGKVEPQELIKRSFEFLLEHEPKESILARFDLRDIQCYFPQFEREIKRKLSRKSLFFSCRQAGLAGCEGISLCAPVLESIA